MPGCVSDAWCGLCNSDHRMLRDKVVVGKRKSFRRDAAGTAVRRWDVSKLKGKWVDERGRETPSGCG